MDAKRLLEIINDIGVWKGDIYKLAYAVAEEQRNESAALVETAGYADLAELVRGA